jgi:hypothetical protein
MTDLFGRRDFLRIGALGALGIGGDGVLPARPAAAASCIVLWQSGGCAHLDTFDMKPDAPLEYRGEFQAIATNVPGIRICEHLPLTARQADKFTILRSVRSRETNHERAAGFLLGGLPPHISLTAPAGMDDLEAESPSLRDRYGRTPLGEGALLARRLVQRGARCVTVSAGSLRYDTHRDHFSTLKNALLPEFDRAFAALLEDLHERAMLDNTLVVAMGEFGRSPTVNQHGGRDHHARAWSVCLAGAGIQGGRVLGATDKHGLEVTDLPVEREDLLHTVCTILGQPSAGVIGGRMIPGLLS